MTPPGPTPLSPAGGPAGGPSRSRGPSIPRSASRAGRKREHDADRCEDRSPLGARPGMFLTVCETSRRRGESRWRKVATPDPGGPPGHSRRPIVSASMTRFLANFRGGASPSAYVPIRQRIMTRPSPVNGLSSSRFICSGMGQMRRMAEGPVIFLGLGHPRIYHAFLVKSPLRLSSRDPPRAAGRREDPVTKSRGHILVRPYR